MAVAVAEEVEDVADGLLFLYLLVDELVDEVDGGAVVLSVGHICQFVDFFGYPLLVLQGALEGRAGLWC